LQEVEELRSKIIDVDEMKLVLSNTTLHNGKLLIDAHGISTNFGQRMVWKEPLTFEIRSGDRIALSGLNGSGKTTLIKLMLGVLHPTSGALKRAACNTVYVDQDYSLINGTQTIYGQASTFNDAAIEEHEIKRKLARFLFTKEDWNKRCSDLSGGERMRLMLCCLTINNQPPDLIILDEPTNNLDLDNLKILTSAIKGYRGTLVVVSHDEQFLEEINVERTIGL
jgi:ATPase subunit of ABC transporter with duplicated ATPase domains